MQTNQKKKTAPVKKPYLTGKPFDNTCVKSVAAVFGGMLIMLFGYTLLGSMMMWDHPLLRYGANALLLGCGYMLFYYSGTSRGTAAVNQGEIMYQRRETGRQVPESELARSFHPLKGFIIGLLGTLPLVICGIVLALTAKRQMTTAGALPTWIATINRPEIKDALTAYTQRAPMETSTVLRLIIRMGLIPLVNIIGADNADGLLLMERLSGLLMLLPGMFYGAGYLRGVAVRTMVHTNIAEGKRKQAQKAKKAQKARKKQQRTNNGPEQLN